jgi:hypothetical protein
MITIIRIQLKVFTCPDIFLADALVCVEIDVTTGTVAVELVEVSLFPDRSPMLPGSKPTERVSSLSDAGS